jgi:UDP-glucose 4-epimerase
MDKSFIIVGGAGFIASHFADRLLLQENGLERVTLFDNFSSGREWHYAHHAGDSRLKVVKADVKDLEALTKAMSGHDVVIHLASNPDIAAAVTDPDIDFREGTALTRNVVEAMRRSGTRTILYASGSGVYGDLGEREIDEDFGPLIPISTYGASKLAGEVLIGSYCHMFDMTGLAFRFGNVVGPRQTHGVGFDFVKRLLKDSSHLRILGNGTQSKSYIHVTDVVAAVLHAHLESLRQFEVFNVATGDYITVREIADLALEVLDLKPGQVRYEFTGGNRGWKGDVPVVRFKTDKIRQLGWRCKYPTREALRRSLLEMVTDVKEGRM